MIRSKLHDSILLPIRPPQELDENEFTVPNVRRKPHQSFEGRQLQADATEAIDLVTAHDDSLTIELLQIDSPKAREMDNSMNVTF